jgi:hypothetical protein
MMLEFEFELPFMESRDFEGGFNHLREKMGHTLKDVQIGDVLSLQDPDGDYLSFNVKSKRWKIGYYPMSKNILSFELMPLF